MLYFPKTSQKIGDYTMWHSTSPPSSISVSTLTEEQKAQVVASALVQELRFTVQVASAIKDKWVGELCDPDEEGFAKKLTFQEKDVHNEELGTAPKGALAAPLGDAPTIEEIRHIFCTLHGDFARNPGTDIEHAFPHSEILKNERRFLYFLNDPVNKVFSQAFLGVPEISDYFRKEEKSKLDLISQSPSKLESKHAPGIIRESNGNIKIIIDGSNGIEIIDVLDDLHKKALNIFYENNKKSKRAVLLKWDHEIMQILESKGHIPQKIKGTLYLYKICYNNIENLWLTCHACNIKKGKSDVYTFFESAPNFGAAFMKAVRAADGMNRGVLLKVVGGHHVATINIDGDNVQVYSGGIGIGRFATDWFFKRYNDEFLLQKRYFSENYASVKKDIQKIQSLKASAEQATDLQEKLDLIQKAKKDFNSLKERVNTGAAILAANSPQHSQASPSDTSSIQDVYQEAIVYHFIENKTKKHDLKILESSLKEKYPDHQTEIHDIFMVRHREATTPGALPDFIEEFCSNIGSLLEKDSLANWAIIKSAIEKSIKTAQETIARLKLETAQTEDLARQLAHAKAELQPQPLESKTSEYSADAVVSTPILFSDPLSSSLPASHTPIPVSIPASNSASSKKRKLNPSS